VNPNTLASQRIFALSLSFSMFRFRKLNFEITAQSQALSMCYSIGLDDSQPTTNDEIVEQAFSRYVSLTTTVPVTFSVPAKALAGGNVPWYVCTPLTPLNPGVFDNNPGNLQASHGAIFFNNSSATVPYPVVVSYVVEFKDPSNNAAGPPIWARFYDSWMTKNSSKSPLSLITMNELLAEIQLRAAKKMGSDPSTKILSPDGLKLEYATMREGKD